MFPGGMGNMQAMMKKVQKMQADMAKMQEDLKSRTVETSVGGGAVTVVVSGKKELKSIKINPTAVDPEDVEMLEDMILTAVNDAMKQIDELTEKEMVRILTEPKNSIIRQYQKLLAEDEVQLEFQEDALAMIAKKAIKNKTGARGLRAQLEELLRTIMFEAPEYKRKTKIIITKEDIEKTLKQSKLVA